MVSLRRAFRPELKRLRTLQSPELALHWWCKDTLVVTYHAKLLNMRDAAKWLEKFMLVVPGESISSTDSASEATRTFAATYEKGKTTLILKLIVSVFEVSENPLAKCRKVQVGVDTHTYTSTTPRYELVCD